MAVDGVAVDVVMALVAGAEVGGNFVVDRFWFYRFLVLGATVFGSSKTKRVLPIGLGARAVFFQHLVIYFYTTIHVLTRR